MVYITGYFPSLSKMPFEQSIGAFKEHFERWLMEAKGFSRSDIKDAECKIGPYPVDWNGFKHGNIFLIGDALPSFSPFADWGIYPAIKSGDLVTKAILGMPYKKDLKRVYKRYKLGIPVGSLFLKDLLENKFSPNSGRIMKKLSSSRSGHLTLSYIGKILARFYKYAPSVTLGYVFNCLHYAPTVVDLYDVANIYTCWAYIKDVDYAYGKKKRDWQKDMDYTPKFF